MADAKVLEFRRAAHLPRGGEQGARIQRAAPQDSHSPESEVQRAPGAQAGARPGDLSRAAIWRLLDDFSGGGK